MINELYCFRYTFTLVSIGDYGSNNDSGVLEESKLGEAFSQNKLDIPPNEEAEWSEKLIPYYLVGDDIFGLHTQCKTKLVKMTNFYWL